ARQIAPGALVMARAECPAERALLFFGRSLEAPAQSGRRLEQVIGGVDQLLNVRRDHQRAVDLPLCRARITGLGDGVSLRPPTANFLDQFAQNHVALRHAGPPAPTPTLRFARKSS